MSTPLVVDQWGMLLSVNYSAKSIGISRKTPAKEAASLGAIVAHVRVVDIETGEKFDDLNSAYRDRSLYKASLDRYRDASEEVMTIMKQALPPSAVFERASIDECFIELVGDDLFEMFPETADVSHLRWEGDGRFDPSSRLDAILARGALLGERIRSEVFNVTGYTASCGVSLTRQVAKLSCAMNKPDKLTAVSSARTTEFMRTVPVKEIRGLGPRAMETLIERVPWVTGKTPCGDLWSVNLGGDDFARWMFDAVRGLNDEQVKETSLVAGSVQSSKQFRPSLPFSGLENMLKSLTADMMGRLENRSAKTLVVTLQCGDTARSRQDRFPAPEDVERLVKELAVKTGLFTPGASYDRLAVTAKDVDTGVEKARKEVAEYLASSRLHFMGTWRTRYLQYIAEVESTNNWEDGAVSEPSKVRLEQLRSTLFPITAEEKSETFLLVDMDCFFCSVAMLLKSIPTESAPCAVASGLGLTSEICSANYAARKYGIRAGSFVASAKQLCPAVQVFAIDTQTLTLCEKIWKQVICVLTTLVGDFSVVHGKSCDEALIDISGCNSACLPLVARQVQEIVVKETGVACSVGVGPTRILAKIATSKAKPAGIRIFNSIQEGAAVLAGDPVKSLPGVGYSTNEKLASIGVETVQDLVRRSAEVPGLIGAGVAKKLLAIAQGLDVEEDLVKDVSTVSAEKNFGLRNLTPDQARELLRALCEAAVGRCLPRVSVERATLKLKLAGDDWQEPSKKGGVGDAHDWSRSVSYSKQIPDPNAIYELTSLLLADIDTTRIRGLGISLKIKVEKKRKFDCTLDRWFAGETLALDKPTHAQPVFSGLTVEEKGGVTDSCVVCGMDVLLGHLTSHMVTHLNQAEVCPCPICFEPIELTDTAHVSGHFPLP